LLQKHLAEQRIALWVGQFNGFLFYPSLFSLRNHNLFLFGLVDSLFEIIFNKALALFLVAFIISSLQIVGISGGVVLQLD